MSEELEQRIVELESKFERLHPSGLTSSSIVKRMITFFGYTVTVFLVADLLYLVVFGLIVVVLERVL